MGSEKGLQRVIELSRGISIKKELSKGVLNFQKGVKRGYQSVLMRYPTLKLYIILIFCIFRVFIILLV